MSAPASSSVSSASTKPPQLSRTHIPPIDTLDSDVARIYTHVHPFLVLSLYGAQFKSIVADPVGGLATALVPLAAVQIVYASLCLPATRENGAAAATSSKSGGGKGTGRRKGNGKARDKAIVALLSSILSIAVGTPLLVICLVLFGAPFTTHWAQTALCGAHMALLAALPLVYVRGVDLEAWRQASALLLPVDEVYGAALGTLVGAWLGAIPIPLDWDREWQKWPVTIVTGAYLGYAAGKYVGLLFKGKAMSLDGGRS